VTARRDGSPGELEPEFVLDDGFSDFDTYDPERDLF
jgi:hypothetical protein